MTLNQKKNLSTISTSKKPQSTGKTRDLLEKLGPSNHDMVVVAVVFVIYYKKKEYLGLETHFHLIVVVGDASVVVVGGGRMRSLFICKR